VYNSPKTGAHNMVRNLTTAHNLQPSGCNTEYRENLLIKVTLAFGQVTRIKGWLYYTDKFPPLYRIWKLYWTVRVWP